MNPELMAEIAVTVFLAYGFGRLMVTETHTMNAFYAVPITAVIAGLLYVGGFFDALTTGPWYAATAVWAWIGLMGMGLGITVKQHGETTENKVGPTLFSGLLLLTFYIVGGLYN